MLVGSGDVRKMLDRVNATMNIGERLIKAVELRYFGGRTEVDTADLLSTPIYIVRRDW